MPSTEEHNSDSFLLWMVDALRQGGTISHTDASLLSVINQLVAAELISQATASAWIAAACQDATLAQRVCTLTAFVATFWVRSFGASVNLVVEKTGASVHAHAECVTADSARVFSVPEPSAN